jgi:hypothetical protein
MKLLIKNVRLAFPQIHRAESFAPGQDPKYQATFIVPKDHPQMAEIEKAIESVISEKWPKGRPRDLVVGLRDGTDKDHLDGFDDSVMFFNANCNASTPPTIIDRDKSKLGPMDDKPAAGDYVNVAVDCWGQENAYGRRVNFSLRGIQFFKQGERFGGGGAADADEFDDYAEEGDSEDPLF